MCGICGVLALKGQKPEQAVVERMTDTLKHRGPDDSGVLVDGPCGLGNRRLAIIDLSQSGHMPMSLPEAPLHISYNGEAYNFGQTRSELQQRGHQFFSGTDTETILRAYAEFGPEHFIDQFNGMFALAIWDRTAQRLVLVRDRLGQKPLYYAQTSDWLVFGSEIKAILAHPDVPKHLNQQAIPYYLAYGYPPTPDTLFEGIQALPPGHMLCAEFTEDQANIELKAYWQPPFPDTGDDMPPQAEVLQELRRLLRQSVEERMLADVPLGAFLSGGLDSATVVALMAQASNKPVKTFAIGFDGADSFDETRYAQEVAGLFQTEHTTFRVKPDVIDLVDTLVHHHDQPFGDSSAIPTYIVSKLAREHVTVALTGDGGDELFAGYDRFYAAKLLQRYKKTPSALRTLIATSVELLPSGGASYGGLGKRASRFTKTSNMPLPQAYLNWVRYTSPEWVTRLVGQRHEEAILQHYMSQSGTGDTRNVLPYLLDLNMRTYLPEDLLVKVDRCSMAVSLEARSPFLDHTLVDFVAGLHPDLKLKGSTKKYILKEAMRDTLPDAIIDRKKHGFGVPVGQWFRTDLQAYVQQTLHASDARIHDLLEPQAVEAMLSEHNSGQSDLGQPLWTLLTLELWLKNTFG